MSLDNHLLQCCPVLDTVLILLETVLVTVLTYHCQNSSCFQARRAGFCIRKLIYFNSLLILIADFYLVPYFLPCCKQVQKTLIKGHPAKTISVKKILCVMPSLSSPLRITPHLQVCCFLALTPPPLRLA